MTSVDWRTYHSLPLGFEVPKIEAVLINRTEGEVMGAGETSITLVAAAIGNAIFDATGARIRQVPFTAERIKAALAALGPKRRATRVRSWFGATEGPVSAGPRTPVSGDLYRPPPLWR